MSVSFKRVAIAKVGEWPASRSNGTPAAPFTEDMFQRIVKNANDDLRVKPKIGVGHIKDRKANGKNGTPALGHLSNLSIDTDPRDGVTTLYADLNEMPKWLPQMFPERSVELWQYPDGEVTISRLAMLGDEPPAVWSLEPTDKHLAAMATDEGPVAVAAAAEAGAVLITGAAVSTPLASNDANPSPVLGADQPDTTTVPDQYETEEPVMDVDLNLVRRSLGLPEDAGVDQINQAAEARATAADESAAEVAAAAGETPAEVVEAPKAELPEGVVAIDAEVLASLKADAEAGRKAAETLAAQERDMLVAAAADEGRIPRGHSDRWAQRFTQDPEGTRVLLTASADEGGLAALVPVGDMVGHSVEAAATADEPSDDDYRGYMKSHYGLEV